jgi:short-subunit dehydrogenase
MGLEYARQLASEGCGLAIVSNRPDELAAAEGILSSEFGVQVATLDMDLCAPGAAAKVLEWCDAEGICPDILINNAGMFFMHYLGSDNLAKASAMVNLHVKAVTELSVLFGSRMKELGRGHILNVASMTAWVPAPGIAVYSASKAYMVSFGKGLSYELRPYGVTVTTVCPAAIDTGLYQLSEKQRAWLRRLGILRSPEWLVRRALRSMKKGRRILRPGFGNHLVPFIVSLMPARLKDRLGMRWINR